MVLIHMKRSDEHQFLYESTTAAQVKDVTRELAEVHNLRLRIQRLKFEGDELANYGPIKTQDKMVRAKLRFVRFGLKSVLQLLSNNYLLFFRHACYSGIPLIYSHPIFHMWFDCRIRDWMTKWMLSV